MKKFRLFAFVVVALTAVQGFSANYYVRKGATGANNGSSWTNAWNEMSQINFSAVSCGDTIWLAGGSYGTSLAAVKDCSGGSKLTIEKVLSTDSVPVGSPGWNSSSPARW